MKLIIIMILGFLLLIVAAVVILVMVAAFRKPKNKNTDPVTGEKNAVLTKGRSNVMEMRRRVMKIKNEEIKSLGSEICEMADRILRTLKQQPDNIVRMRQFFNYYLPTLGKILEKYVRVEESGVPAEDITKHTILHLGEISEAMEKQYNNLFDDDILDLSVEMEALTMACKRDGLLDDNDFIGVYNLKDSLSEVASDFGVATKSCSEEEPTITLKL